MRRIAAAVGLAGMSLVVASGAWAQDNPWVVEPPAVTSTAAATGTASPTATSSPVVTSTSRPAVSFTASPTGTAAPSATVTPHPTPGTPTVTSTVSVPEPTAEDIWGSGKPNTKVTSLASDPKFARTVKPIEEQIVAVAKIQDLHDKEMTKPEKQRSVTLLKGYKTSIAQGYLKASGMARMAEAQFTKPDDKKQLADAYEYPLRARAVSLFLEMADDAMTRKDYRDARSLYEMVLQIDPTNETAKEGKKKVLDLSRPSGPPSGAMPY
jgi:hypothetical protein